MTPDDLALIARLAPPAPTDYHRLNPLTKLTVAVAVTIGAIVLGGYVLPLALLALIVVPSAAVAGLLPRVVRLGVLVSLPIVISVVLVSVFTRKGTTVLFDVGPFDVTMEGADFAAQTAIRLVLMAMALVLFGLTTPQHELVSDLERRGVSPRLTFALAASLEAAPALIERGRTVVAAQRARGLDTEGSVGARLRGIKPMAVPVLLSTLAEVEERSLALEARGFGRTGRRELLWAPADSAAQGVTRWLLATALLLVVVARASGALAGLP
jgi:energy-coupling factor transport system permease protein